MKIISWNVNGLRAIWRRDFSKWIKSANADIYCFQEIKLQKAQLPEELARIRDYYQYFNFAKKPGYSGMAVFTKKKPIAVEHKLCFTRFDNEGRLLRLQYGDFTLINIYLPHGGRQKENLGYKLEVYKFLLSYLKRLEDKNIILVGDFNVAHQEVDLARPKQNKNNIMFTSEEREQLDKVVNLGFTDTFRMFHQEGGWYTWWPYFANASPVRNFSKVTISKKEFAKISNGARARNLGWRIDYCFTSESLAPKVKKAFILSDVIGSDHCPIGVEIK